ncbi:alpha/beta hydrolase [Neobacillus sp. OS1-2]|uniref:alpha/beta fold hydrolase n=1 Tax=Neobacillus sp. OS1-2 TaxID=3070680 RepID=UPI0027DF503C|nr:alpha/beta hydrolase [Neobacillus sp. OS1-2]WML39884.1 alpha/beta hydrolase [Neobacillus sp. OS1-2]
MNTKSVKLSDATIGYVDQGEGNPIVLLHGFCGSSRYWEKVIPELSKSYRVIALDLPGHGESSMGKDGYSIEDYADNIKGLLDQLHIQKVTMFGHSLGGYITLAFAEKYSGHLNGFSLVHSTAFPDSDEAKKGRMANVEKVNIEGIKVLIDGLVPKLFSPENVEQDYVNTAIEIGYSTSPRGAISALTAMKNRMDRNHVLKTTSLPVLLLAGEQDQIIPAEKTFSVSGDNIQQKIVKNAGHMSMYENHQDLILEIQEYLARI